MILEEGGILDGLGVMREEVFLVVRDAEVAKSVIDERVPVLAIIKGILSSKLGVIIDEGGDEDCFDFLLVEVRDI